MEQHKEYGVSPDIESRHVIASKEKIKKDTEKLITALFDNILDLSEVAIGDPQRYKSFRSKVLRFGNDSIREFKKIVDQDYRISYVPTKEDVIQFSNPTVPTRRIGGR